ncbi:MAG: dCMP deaminase family protein [Candidatus Nitrotoga sp.]|nr:dCMP deaminase family protein [Candidatus Nitrotoga sp.]MDP1854773.1 dCMP deaminase family protein [Candidatus Nitrotoga sp.]
MQLEIDAKPVAKWDQRFIELSKYVSEWSKDPKARVGAVIVSQRGGSMTLGYNGFPMGVEDSAERLDDPQVKLELIVHAEQNALIAAGDKANGATIYVWGKPVCARCAGAIIQAGIKRVVAMSPDTVDKQSKWYKTGKFSIEMFEEADVKVDFFTVTDADN